MAYNEKGLLHVIEFEKQKLEQMINKEQIAEAAEKYAEQEKSAWTNDYNGFIAGAMFVQQLLQQTAVSGALPVACIDGFTNDKFCVKIGECEWCRDKRQ